METCDFHDVASIVLREIDRGKSRPDWENVWSEESAPPYFNNSIIRYNQKFFRAPGEEAHHLNHLLRDLIPENSVVHEFGCGPGMNLEIIKERAKAVFGYDIANSAVNRLKEKNIPGLVFDMESPYYKPLDKPEVALTVHALEQLQDCKNFMRWLILNKFQTAIHIEPIYELYDKYNMVDRLAMMWHDTRGYVKGLPKTATPSKLYRTWIGGMMHEAYSVMVWYPS